MKFAVLNIAIMVMSLASYVTAGAKNNYRAIYSFQYTKDSINSLKGNDILYLEISENKSFCFSYYSYQSDSLRRDPNGRKIWRQMFSAAISKDGTNATSFPHQRSTFKISKYNNSDTISIKDVIDRDIFEYQTSKKDFNWNVCDTTKDIAGYTCYKATSNFHGRLWIVWFSFDLAISDGPWVLCGLPGLILEAHDSDNLYSFKLIGLDSTQKLKEDWTKKGKQIDRIRFLKEKYKYLKNLTSVFNAEMGINISSNSDTRFLDGLEPDFLNTKK